MMDALPCPARHRAESPDFSGEKQDQSRDQHEPEDRVNAVETCVRFGCRGGRWLGEWFRAGAVEFGFVVMFHGVVRCSVAWLL